MLDDFQRIQIFSELLPSIKRLSHSTIVIKYGGSAMKDQLLKDIFINDLLLLSFLGARLILVHGGGPIINMWLKKCNIEPKFSNGVRVTDEQTMEIVEMVLVGKVNKDLVALLNKNISCAIGISGKDGNLLVASPLFDSQENFVGKVDHVNTELLTLLLNQGYIPVVASVASAKNGQAYNINADTVAGAIAGSLSAEKLVLLTDTPGIMSDINDSSTLIRHITIEEAKKLKARNVISGGMIPKVDCSIDALQSNVNSVHIIDGRVKHALLLEILTENGIGSVLTK